MPTTFYSLRPSSKKSLFTANVDQHREPQRVTMQRPGVAESPAAVGISTSQLLHPWLREHSGKGAERVEKPKYQGFLIKQPPLEMAE